MCFDPVSFGVVAVTTALTSMAASAIQQYSQNKATAQQYNAQVDRSNELNQAALRQYQETTSRLNINQQRQGMTAFEQTQRLIAENQKRMSAARASAGSSGLMGLPLNMVDQEFMATIGGLGTNLTSQYQQLNENLFFDLSSARLSSMDVMSRNTPGKPFFQKFGWDNVASSLISGVAAGVGAGMKSNVPQSTQPLFSSPEAQQSAAQIAQNPGSYASGASLGGSTADLVAMGFA